MSHSDFGCQKIPFLFPDPFQMFQTILIGIALVVLSSIGYVLLKAYWKQSSKKEEFQAALVSVATPAPTMPLTTTAVSPEPPRVVAPAGPNPPNAAAAPSKKVSFAPDTQARDPFDDVQGETPMTDSLRHPERSFGPGVENTNTRMAVDSGVASREVAANGGSFSPEFAQNGGEFMSGILANDAYGDATYANA
jgi:hypothetical protein